MSSTPPPPTIPSPPSNAMPTSLPPAAPIAVSTPDLSVELDELLIEYLASLDVYQARQSRLATQLKSGYFDLARAKQALGPTRVGVLSYDLGEALPSVLVEITPSAALSTAPSNDPSGDSLDFNVIPAPPPIPTEDTKESEKTTALDTATVLRQRALASSSPSPTSPTPPSPTSKEPTPRPLQRDAALQFSAMPPPALRDAQRGFKKVLQAAVELVASQRELAGNEGRIEELKARIAQVEQVVPADL